MAAKVSVAPPPTPHMHVKFRKFKEGELVLKVAMDVKKEVNVGKMVEK